MTTKLKNYLGVAIIISILLLALAGWGYAQAYKKSVDTGFSRSFFVSSQGKVVAVPDIAQFTFSVITEGGKDVGVLQKENVEKVNKAIDFIKSQKVDAKDIKTESYNLIPRTKYYSCPRDGGACPPSEIVGYTITQTVSVKIRDFSKIGDLLSGIIQNGANSVSSLNFTIDDPTKLENDARAEAISKAKEKARAIAEAGGFKLGKLLEIQETGQPIYPLYLRKELGYGGDGAGAPLPSPTIEPGSQDVQVTVTLRYEID